MHKPFIPDIKYDFIFVVPVDIETNTRLSKHIELSIPIVSAAMDTVTEARTSISVAREGGVAE